MSLDITFSSVHESNGWIVADTVTSRSERATLTFAFALLLRTPKDRLVHVVAGMQEREHLLDLLFALRQIGDPVHNYWRLVPTDKGAFALKARGKSGVRWTFPSYEQVALAAQAIDQALALLPTKD